jgi:hypothetical protein
MLAPFSSSETQAALELVKSVEKISMLAPDFIDERALELVGASSEEIESAIAEMRRELADELAACNPPPSESRIAAYVFPTGELIRDRLKEIERNGSGCA